MRATFAELGDIRATDILSGLVALWREGASGSLRFSRSGATAGFHLSAGEVTTVWSSESRFETASILLRAGKLDSATLERLSTPQGTDRALSALHAGILTKREWRWGEKIRAVEVLSDLLTWIEGDYTFDRGAHSDAGEFRLTVPRLVLELFLRSRDRGLVLHYLGGADVPLARAPHFDSEFIAFGLTADAEAVVRLIDGKATAAQIASEGPAEPFAVEKLLAALVTLGLVHPEFVPAEAGPPPSRAESPEEAEEAGEIGEDREEVSAEAEAEEPAADEGDEAYAELDVPVAPHADEEPRFEADLRGLPEDTPEEEEEESPIEASELAGEPSIAAERLHPLREHVADSPLERARYGELDDVGDAEIADAGAGNLDEALPPAAESRRPLDLATGIGSLERPKRRSAAPFLLLLAVLAAGVAGVILFRGRGAATRAAAVVETPTPAATASRELAVLSAEISPIPTGAPTTPAASTPRPEPTRPALLPTQPPPRPTASAAKTAAPSPRPTSPAPKPTIPAARTAPAEREVPAGNRQAWLDRAARDRQRAASDGKSHFTIQLELACEVPTLVDAWKYDRPAGTLWVLTTPYDGRTCFRVLWGRYPTKEAARRALSGVPPFFSSGRNRPVVTAIR